MHLIGSGERLLAPEVVQTSAMDCGPAALKCLLEGFGIPVSYGRLREACQTDVDGTSIDVLEDVAVRLGLDAEQVMIPADHLLLREAEALPALLVVVRPGGMTHFVVVWRRWGRLVQVMDPAIGRRWLTTRELLDETYVHSLPVPAADWQAWARSAEFSKPLGRRLRKLGCRRRGEDWLDEAISAGDWQPLAALDAATRMAESLVRAGGLRRGRDAARMVDALRNESCATSEGRQPAIIPDAFWSVQPVGPAAEATELTLRGAVLIRVRGRRTATPPVVNERVTSEPARSPGEPLGVELQAALAEPRPQPLREMLRRIGPGARRSAALLCGGLVLSAAGLVLEAMLLRAAMETARDLGLVEQRLGAVAVFLVFAIGLLLVDLQVLRGLLRMGRALEVRLRMAFLDKIPRLNDRYFQSRPTSDMAQRSHTSHQLRNVPWLGGELVRRGCAVVLTALAIALVYPGTGPPAALAAVAALGVPLAFRRRLEEQDLRVRTHTGALARFYFDALVGLVPIRAHAAERAIRREHESLLVEWTRAGLRLVRTVTLVEAVVTAIGLGLAGWLLARHLALAAEPAGALLLAYWALQLPVLGGEFGLLVAQLPYYRSTYLRLAEPLGAPEEPLPVRSATSVPVPKRGGVAVEFQSVDVAAAGHPILREVSLRIDAGAHVAVVGTSGAGKSSLVGLLLGWHRPAQGMVWCDGEPLSAETLDQLRRETVWIDPTVQIWNRSLAENLEYARPAGGGWGENRGGRPELGRVLAESQLHDVLERLPEGLQTRLGESGGLLSAGEGQRVRLGRALLRGRARLVILDEAFRGLEHSVRRELLERARRQWREATLLCITHDLADTTGFDRVLVLEQGRVVEDGAPDELAMREGSRYRALLEAAGGMRSYAGDGHEWRLVMLTNGVIHDAKACGDQSPQRDGLQR